MASSNLNRVWDRQLSTEERQYLSDLKRHPGFQLCCMALQELMAQDLRTLLSSANLQEISQMQGSYQRSLDVLEMPAKLLEVPSPISRS